MNIRSLLRMSLIGAIVAGCTPPAPGPIGEDARPSTTIRFAVLESQRAQFEVLAAQFQAETPGVAVEIVAIESLFASGSVGFGTIDGWRRLASSADTLVAPFDPTAIRAGIVQDLTPFIESDRAFDRDDFYPAALEALQSDDGLWGLPVSIRFEVIAFDRAAFDQAGVAAPQPGWTWDDFLAKAQAMTQSGGGDVTRWGFVQPILDPRPFIAGRADLRGETADPPALRVNQPDAVAALTWFVDLIRTHNVMPFFDNDDGGQGGYTLIAQQRAALWPENSGNLLAGNPEPDVGIAPYPVEQPDDATTPVYVEAYSMSAGTAHPQESWQWLTFLSRQAQAGAELPARRALAEAGGFWEQLRPDVAATYRFALDHASRPIFEAGVFNALNAAVAAVLNDEMSAQDALNQAQATLEARAVADVVTPAPVVVSTPTPPGDAIGITFAVSDFELAASYRRRAEEFNAGGFGVQVEVRIKEPTLARDVDWPDLAADSDCFVWNDLSDYALNRQSILDLQPLVEADASFPADDFYAGVIEQFRDQGRLWAVPLEARINVIYFNPVLFDAAGVPAPGPGWTLDDFLLAAQALTRGEGDGRTYGFLSLSLFYTLDMDVFSALRGARRFDTDRDPLQPFFNDPVMVDAVRWYADLSAVHGLNRVSPAEDPFSPETVDFEQRRSLIRQGRVAMWMTFLGDYVVSDNVSVAPLPLDAGGVIPGYFEGAYISANTSNPQACWTWMRYLADHGGLITGRAPVRRSMLESPEYAGRVGVDRAAAMRFSFDHVEAARVIWPTESWRIPAHRWYDAAARQVISERRDAALALDEAQHKAEAYVLCLQDDSGFDDEQVQVACAKQVDPHYATSE